MVTFESTKIIELGSCAFRQWRAVDTHCCKLHGYRLMAKFWFGCTGLDDKNWVINFGGLKEIKKVLQEQFDHTLCIAKDDPLLEHFKELDQLGGCVLKIMDGVGIEKTAEWCFKTVDPMIREMSVGRCWLNKVEVWEHDLNSAIYEKRS